MRVRRGVSRRCRLVNCPATGPILGPPPWRAGPHWSATTSHRGRLVLVSARKRKRYALPACTPARIFHLEASGPWPHVRLLSTDRRFMDVQRRPLSREPDLLGRTDRASRTPKPASEHNGAHNDVPRGHSAAFHHAPKRRSAGVGEGSRVPRLATWSDRWRGP